MTTTLDRSTLTLINDGQVRWSVDTAKLARALVRNGYTRCYQYGFDGASEPHADAYSFLCAALAYDESTNPGDPQPGDRSEYGGTMDYEPSTFRHGFVLGGAIVRAFRLAAAAAEANA